MSYDIFLSYSTADRERLKPLVEAFKQNGWSVFQDSEEIHVGDGWQKKILQSLKGSKCVVAVWSDHSLEKLLDENNSTLPPQYTIRSSWVESEVGLAIKKGVLIPITFDGVTAPFGFEKWQTLDFSNWNSTSTHPAFTSLASQIYKRLTPVKIELEYELPPLSQEKAPFFFEPRYVKVDSGSFMMGYESGRDDVFLENAQNRYHPPVRKEQISSFWMAETLITVEQYLAGVDAGACRKPVWLELGSEYHYKTGTKDDFKRIGGALMRDDFPIVGISWEDAKVYCSWLSKQTGKTWCLPTEAEWEYACRAGQEYVYAGGNNIDALAWYELNSRGKMHPVGQKLPNAFGLYDMSGNVWEWIDNDLDTPPSSEGNTQEVRKVLRGGSWINSAQDCRIATRNGGISSGRFYSVGFRPAMKHKPK
jgi:formylglycine-generating enzyme required for sulfatase activity